MAHFTINQFSFFVFFRNYMNDCLRTNVFVRFDAETIACACIYLAARVLQIPLPNKPHWFLLFGATEENMQEICVTALRLYTRKKPNFEVLDKEVEKRKVALQEAKLKAKGLNPDGTPALSTMGGFSPASKPSTPREVKVEEKSPVLAKVKREPDEKQSLKSPYNGMRKEMKRSRSGSRSRSRTKSRSRSPRRHYNNRRSRSGTYSSRSRSRSRSHSDSPRRHHNHGSPHLKSKHRGDDLRVSNRHGHKRKKSHSPTPGKSREHGDPAKKHRHDRSHHHRDRRERSRSFERSHKSKHHSSSHSGHSRHRR